MNAINLTIGILIFLLLLIFAWFAVPYSPLKAEFNRAFKNILQKNTPAMGSFSPALLAGKPKLLRDYIAYCGLLNRPMMHHSVTTHNDVDFLLQTDKPMVKIQYTQINFANSYERLAFIDTKMADVVPFQGLDALIDGAAKMHGVLGKLCTVFNVGGHEMNQSAMVTVLAEGIVCPSFFMNEDIVWEPLDDKHLKATISQDTITVSGVFEFDENGAIISFYTKDRYQEDNGQNKKLDWIARCGSYAQKDGVKRPTFFQGVWVLPDGTEQIYFDCKNVDVQFCMEN